MKAVYPASRDLAALVRSMLNPEGLRILSTAGPDPLANNGVRYRLIAAVNDVPQRACRAVWAGIRYGADGQPAPAYPYLVSWQQVCAVVAVPVVVEVEVPVQLALFDLAGAR